MKQFNLNILKKIGIGIVSLVGLYFFILLVTPKPELPADIKIELQRLNRLTDSLRANQAKYDSSIKLQERKDQELNLKIDNIKEKTTIIREYYHERVEAANAYTPSQVDSFLRKRYSY